MTEEKVHRIIAGSLLVVMLAVYILTAAPTLSFWDCGEFITCSYIMGIPHPPGSPLLSLIGRVMSLVPFHDFRGPGASEIAYRVNMIDVILGALTVMLTYLIMIRLIRRFRPFESRLDTAIAMFTAVMTALMAGFANDFWENSIETETYMPSLFMQMVTLWLVLRWEERRDDPKAVRYLFCSAYILGLGNGVHLTVLLIAPTLFLIVLFTKPEWFRHTRLWTYTAGLFIVAELIKLFAGLGVQYGLMAAFALFAPLVLFRMFRGARDVWKLTFLGFVFCGSLYIIGFSVYPTVMVRANKSPAINEGNPDNWERYKLYITRDQYGQENMYTGMFVRKASFHYQFGCMYLRYLIQQFPIWGPTVTLTFENDRSPDQSGPTHVEHDVYLPVLLLSVLLYGLYTHGREDWRTMAPLLLFFAASSVGLVLYLNMENPQVRERSYFFLGSYYIIMYWIGFGIWGLITDIREWVAVKQPKAVVPAVTALCVLFGTLVPSSVLSRHIDPHFTNWEVHDRSHDWMPYDYAYNILVSCEPNAILFTNGDNDTFPLWYLQEVKGFRKDVRLVNLSLLNTDWYILQLKHETQPIPGEFTPDGKPVHNETLPIEYSDEFITDKLCGRDEAAMSIRVWPVEGQEVSVAGITWNLPAALRIPMGGGETLGMIRVQDVMVLNIIRWNDWKRPIYYAVTVSGQNRIGLDPYLSMEGMVYRLVREPAGEDEILVNVPVMHENVMETYQYRSLDDPEIYKPPNTLKLVTNYFIGFAQLCERYASAGDQENAVKAAWGAINRTPNDFRKRAMIYQALLGARMTGPVREFVEWEMEGGEWRNDRANRVLMYRLLHAGRMNDLLSELIEIELAKPDFMEGGDEALEERLQIYALLNQSGKKALADSLVALEQEMLKKKTNDPAALIAFGARLIQSSLDDQAKKLLGELTAARPDDIDAWQTYIAALYGTGDYEGALEALDHLLTLTPDDASLKQTRELLLRMSGRNGADSLPPALRSPAEE